MEFQIQHLLPLEINLPIKKGTKHLIACREIKTWPHSTQSLAIKYLKGGLIVILDKSYYSIMDVFCLQTVGKLFEILK